MWSLFNYPIDLTDTSESIVIIQIPVTSLISSKSHVFPSKRVASLKIVLQRFACISIKWRKAYCKSAKRNVRRKNKLSKPLANKHFIHTTVEIFHLNAIWIKFCGGKHQFIVCGEFFWHLTRSGFRPLQKVDTTWHLLIPSTLLYDRSENKVEARCTSFMWGVRKVCSRPDCKFSAHFSNSAIRIQLYAEWKLWNVQLEDHTIWVENMASNKYV
jgi:hypothetical protein